MLLALTIHNFVIVDRLHLELFPGFSVLTGETGAGKSIILDALSLLLGGRADGKQVREGERRAELSAVFDISHMPEVNEWLDEQALQEDGHELLLRRVLDNKGRSRHFINGQAVALSQLKTLGEFFVDIHGQHAHQSLIRPDIQRKLLDAYAGTIDLSQTVCNAWHHWSACRKKRQEAEAGEQSIQIERERLNWQINELTEASIHEGEWEEINQRHTLLSHVQELQQVAHQAIELLAEHDVNCLGILNQVQQRIQKISDFDPVFKDILLLMDSVETELDETVHLLRNSTANLEEDPQAFIETEDRLNTLHGLARKYRIPPNELPAKLNEWLVQLTQLDADSNVEILQAAEDAALKQYMTLAEQLSQQRHSSASALSSQITHQMASLSMTGAKFCIKLHPATQPGANGLEHIEYQVAANTGGSLRPLSKVASGGELSRISLALQVVMSQIASVPTLIFDEVDSGIGGGVAEVVGRLLRQLSTHYQVIAITHLPQVASCGDYHYVVSKCVDGTVTTSDIQLLNQVDRVKEIARMLGGKQITDTTLLHAQEMLQNNRA